MTAAVSIPPIPAGEARIWFYRDYEPYAGKGLPAIAANGGYVGAAELGGAFYRDVPPGHYLVTVETVGIDTNQTANFELARRPGGLCKNRLAAELGHRRGQEPMGAADLLRVADPEPNRASRCRASRFLWRQLDPQKFSRLKHLAVVVVREDLGVPAPIDHGVEHSLAPLPPTGDPRARAETAPAGARWPGRSSRTRRIWAASGTCFRSASAKICLRASMSASA